MVRDKQGVVDKFGVRPQSIPDYLALAGHSADGHPGILMWAGKSAAAVLSRREEALLYRRLALLRTDVPFAEKPVDLEGRGASPALKELSAELGDERILARITKWRDRPA